MARTNTAAAAHHDDDAADDFVWLLGQVQSPPVNAASNAEPFPKPDHKAKKHGRPTRKTRRGEHLGAGHFVFRRNANGRVMPGGFPFEHPSAELALDEAARLHVEFGGKFEVYSRVEAVGAEVA